MRSRKPPLPAPAPDGEPAASLAKAPSEEDRVVGLRITALRKAKGLSQTALGQAIGVTFQQVQKYEKGRNRVGAGRLHEIAQLLDVPVSALFSEASGEGDAGEDGLALLRVPGALDLMRAYAAIEDEAVRRDLVRFVGTLAGSARRKP